SPASCFTVVVQLPVGLARFDWVTKHQPTVIACVERAYGEAKFWLASSKVLDVREGTNSVSSRPSAGGARWSRTRHVYILPANIRRHVLVMNRFNFLERDRW